MDDVEALADGPVTERSPRSRVVPARLAVGPLAALAALAAVPATFAIPVSSGPASTGRVQALEPGDDPCRNPLAGLGVLKVPKCAGD